MLHVLLALILLCTVTGGPPRVDTVQRFPFTAAQAKQAVDFGDVHVKWLEEHGHRVIVKAQRFWWVEDVPVESDWLLEARWRRDCWQALAQAKAGVQVRDSLTYLRSLIGDAAFDMGLMPDYAPWRRFEVLKK